MSTNRLRRPSRGRSSTGIGQYIPLNGTETFDELRAKHAELEDKKDVEKGGLTVEQYTWHGLNFFSPLEEMLANWKRTALYDLHFWALASPRSALRALSSSSSLDAL